MTAWILLRTRALILKNTLLRRSRRENLRVLAALIAFGYLAVAIFQGTVRLFELLASSGQGAAEAMLATTFSGLVTFALFWGIGYILNQLYVSSDLELLLAAPIPPRTVYGFKLVEGMQSMLLPGALSAASLLAYGAATGGDALYYVLALVGFGALLALLASLAMVAVMLMVRVLPAQRTREIWTMLWTIVVGIIWVVWMVSSRGQEGNAWAQLLMRNDPVVSQAGAVLGWSPAGWLARTLVAWQAGFADTALLYLAVLVGTSALCVLLGYRVYRRAFYRGWSSMQEAASRRPKAARRSGRDPLSALLAPLPPQHRAIISKEWRSLPRDLRRLSTLLFPILMGAVYVYMTATGELSSAMPEATIWITMAITPLVPFFMSIYNTVGTMGLEGQQFALLRAAPIPSARLLWAKFWATLGPTLLVSEVIALVTALALGASLAQALLALLSMGWFCAGFTAIGVGASTVDPNFRAANARRSVSITTTYGVMFLGAAFWIVQLAAALWLLLEIGPAPISALIEQLLVLAVPQAATWIDSAWALPILIGAEALVMVLIAWLWRRGAEWLREWEVTALD